MKGSDITRKIDRQENHDETYSPSGKKDFYRPEGEVRNLGTDPKISRPRPRRSENNSYT